LNFVIGFLRYSNEDSTDGEKRRSGIHSRVKFRFPDVFDPQDALIQEQRNSLFIPTRTLDMNYRTLLFMIAAIATALVALSEPLFARGGAASIMNSPGYQRRLQESRQQLPHARASSSSRHKWRHRKH
jgi:hypothetical protein